MDKNDVSARFCVDGVKYQLRGSAYFPAVKLPDGRFVQFQGWYDTNPLTITKLEILEKDKIWEMVLEYKAFEYKEVRTRIPEFWFKWSDKRCVADFKAWGVGALPDGTVLAIDWEWIGHLWFDKYTEEERKDITSYCPMDILELMQGMLSDWYRATNIREIRNLDELIASLPMAEIEEVKKQK